MATYGETDRVLVRLQRIYRTGSISPGTEVDLLQLGSSEWAELELYGWDLEDANVSLAIGFKPIGGGTTTKLIKFADYNTVQPTSPFTTYIPIPDVGQQWPLKFNIFNEYWEPGVNKQSLYLANISGSSKSAKVHGTMRVFKGT